MLSALPMRRKKVQETNEIPDFNVFDFACVLHVILLFSSQV